MSTARLRDPARRREAGPCPRAPAPTPAPAPRPAPRTRCPPGKPAGPMTGRATYLKPPRRARAQKGRAASPGSAIGGRGGASASASGARRAAASLRRARPAAPAHFRFRRGRGRGLRRLSATGWPRPGVGVARGPDRPRGLARSRSRPQAGGGKRACCLPLGSPPRDGRGRPGGQETPLRRGSRLRSPRVG